MIENVGSLLACIGAIYNCSPNVYYKRIAFGIWIVSNVLLLIWAWIIQAWGPAAMYLLFVGTASYGFMNHKEKGVV